MFLGGQSGILELLFKRHDQDPSNHPFPAFLQPKKTPATCPPSLGCSGQGEDFILRGYTMCTAQARNLEAWQSSPEFLTRPGADLDTEMVGLGGGFLMGHFGLGISETLESYGLVNELLESLELE